MHTYIIHTLSIPLSLQLMAQYFPWFQLDGFEERGDKKKEGEIEQQGKNEEGGVRRENEKKLKAPELNW